ncbi:pseudouridine synthase, putative [Leishmania panamensis]|uniref:Pseudouridine synthase, putative n=1 Tax=Leishmania panamensis TaxID=5679 RepID=A0A088RZS4_LEIPA
MKCTTRWCDTGGVVAAMERAHRYMPKQTFVSRAPADGEAEYPHKPHYLIPDLQRYAERQQEHQHAHKQPLSDLAQLNEPAMSTPTVTSATLAYFIQTAKNAFKRSLASFQHQALASQPATRSAATCTATWMPQSPVGLTGGASRYELEAAVRGYNPTVDRALLQQIAARLAIANTLRMARQLARYLHESAAAARDWKNSSNDDEHQVTAAQAVALLRRAADVCRAHYVQNSADMHTTSRPMSPSLWALTSAARESAGIATRLHYSSAATTRHAHRRRRQPPRCFLRYTSDVQVNEVLPNGAVVTFTHATRPEEVGYRAAPAKGKGREGGPGTFAAAAEARRGLPYFSASVSFRESLESCLTSCPSSVYLHFVLYRHGVSLAAAIADIVKASEGLISAHDVCVSIHMPENDEHVAVQTCSIRMALPMSTQPLNVEDAVQHCMHTARVILQLNLAGGAPRVALQLLACHTDPCGEQHTVSRVLDESPTRLQYALLLRGFDQRGGPLNQLDHASLACATCVPNYFSPHHFGAAAVPFFRTYHVTEALAKRRYADAAVMMACLEVEAVAETNNEVPPWLERALQLLCCGEDREGVWQAWWIHEVPAAMRRRMVCAKSDLVWNVLASFRLRELAMATGGRRDVLLAAAPKPGDFVLQPEEARDGGARSEIPSPLARSASVTVVHNQAQAAHYSVHDIAVPLVLDTSSESVGCESLADIEAQLGFTSDHCHSSPLRRSQRSRQSHTSPSAVTQTNETAFRPLLIAATGYPRAARPWCRSFPEPPVGPVVGHPKTALECNATVFTLSTDLDLASQTAAARDYAAKSRGPRARVWPLSKRGRALTDRLPAGLMAVASADGSSLLSSASAANHHGSRCLAIHCTLPARLSLANFVSELAVVEDLRDSWV